MDELNDGLEDVEEPPVAEKLDIDSDEHMDVSVAALSPITSSSAADPMFTSLSLETANWPSSSSYLPFHRSENTSTFARSLCSATCRK